MAIDRSTGLVNYIASKGSVRQALSDCRVLIFGNTKPSGTGAADTGSGGVDPLVQLTLDGGVFTGEDLPSWRFTMAGSAGQVDSVKLGGVEQLALDASRAATPVAYVSSLAQLATDIVAAINNNSAFPDYSAAVSGVGSDEVTIYGPSGCGASLNSQVLEVTASSGITATEIGAGAVESAGVFAVNAGNWGYVPATGQISKEATAWSGVIDTGGTAVWFMIVTADDDGKSSSTLARRIIGTVGTSGADLNLSAVAFTAGASVTVNSWTLTVNR